MDGLEYEKDDRTSSPDEVNYRRFRQGWNDAKAKHSYHADALEALTWQNLGWRLGKLLPGYAEDSTIERVYRACVQQQADEQRAKAKQA